MQAALQTFGQVALFGVEPGVVEGEAGSTGGVDQVGDVFGAEPGASFAAEHRQQPDRAATARSGTTTADVGASARHRSCASPGLRTPAMVSAAGSAMTTGRFCRSARARKASSVSAGMRTSR